MSEPFRVLIVGAGLMGNWHARYAQTGGGRVCGIVDCSQRAADRLASKFRHCRSWTDLHLSLTQTKPGIVHVCTPVESHRDIAKAALETGAHAIVEKPLAVDAKASEELLRLARDSGLLLIPVHQFLFQDGFRKACRAVSRLGRILHVDIVICSAGGDQGTRNLDDIAAEILPHPLSLIERLAPGSLDDREFSVHRSGEGEWRICWCAKRVSFSVLISLRARPTEASMRIAAERGAIELDLFHGFSTIDSAQPTRAAKLARPFRRSAAQFSLGAANLMRRASTGEFAYPGLRTLISEFHEAARHKGPSPISPEEILAVAVARDQILARSKA